MKKTKKRPYGRVIVKPTETKAGTRMAIISKVSVKRVRASAALPVAGSVGAPSHG